MGAFKDVREAFAAQINTNLGTLGIKVVGKRPQREWLQMVCPFCGDTNGSASVSINSGHLKCHQCSTSDELFTWVMRKEGISEKWAACQWLAQAIHATIRAPIATATRRTRSREPAMTEELLSDCTTALASSPQAEACREFLRARGLGDPEWCDRLDIGYLDGRIIFAQRTADGAVRQRFRTYSPNGKLPWGWAGPKPPGGAATNGFWPSWAPPNKALILLHEGEWDCWTAYEVLELHKQAIYPFTFTGGAKAIPATLMPKWLKDRDVWVIPDNDVFQDAEWLKHVAPSDKQRLEMERRRKALLETCETLTRLGCKVKICAIPIDARELWGADFRDWVTRGGRDINQLPSWTYTEVLEAGKPKPKRIPFDEIWLNVGDPITFECRLTEVGEQTVTLPALTQIECPMGEWSCCNSCRVPTHYPNQVIDWSREKARLLSTALAKDPERETATSVLGRPRGCSYLELIDRSYVKGYIWKGGSSDDSESSVERTISIVSDIEPSISSVMRVTGTPYHVKGRQVAVLCDTVEIIDSTNIDLKPSAAKAIELLPRSTDLSSISKGVARVADDVSSNITRIFGRRAMHIAMLLAMCSPRWISLNKKRVRGWLDISIIGTTGTGKTDMWNQFIQQVGLGKLYTSMTNTSRAGFVMGATPGANRQHTVRPGEYPRMNGRLIVIDEAHLMGETSEGRILGMLQSARETGFLDGIKVYGAKRMPSQVRLVTLANPVMKGGARYYRYACQNLGAIYGPAEAIRRIDFCLWIESEHDGTQEIAPQVSKEFMRDTILRAWGQHEPHVHITKDAEDLARQHVEEWSRFYSPDGDVPLFSGADMVGSLLRIAASCSNILWHHTKDDVRVAHVTPEHVSWAATWLEWTWEKNDYTKFTALEARARVLEDPFALEATLLVRCGLSEPDEAIRVLESLTGELAVTELAMVLSLDSRDVTQWMGPFIRMGVVDTRDGTRHKSRVYRFTPGAQDYIVQVIRLARHCPTVYRERFTKISEWNNRGRHGTISLERADEMMSRLESSDSMEK